MIKIKSYDIYNERISHQSVCLSLFLWMGLTFWDLGSWSFFQFHILYISKYKVIKVIYHFLFEYLLQK